MFFFNLSLFKRQQLLRYPSDAPQAGAIHQPASLQCYEHKIPSALSRQLSAVMLPSKPNLAPLRFRWNHQLADGIKDRFDLVIFSLYWISQFVISNFPFLPL